MVCGQVGRRAGNVAAINDDNSGSPGTALPEYSYNGAGRLVVEDFSQPDVKLDYFGGTGGSYAGFDRFGRVVQQLWRYYGGAPADRDKFTYAYDRNDNRLFKKNPLTSDKDELYTYDNLDRLTKAERGTVSGSSGSNAA